MFNRILATVLAAAALFATASAEAQNRRHGGVVMSPQPSPAHYRCNPDGQAASPGTGWCVRNTGPSVSVPPQPGNPPVMQQQQMGAPIPVRPLSPSEMDNLKQVVRGEMQQQQRPVVYPAAPARSPASSSAATQQQQQEVKIVIQQAPSTAPVVTSQSVTPAPGASQASPAHEQGIVIDKM